AWTSARSTARCRSSSRRGPRVAAPRNSTRPTRRWACAWRSSRAPLQADRPRAPSARRGPARREPALAADGRRARGVTAMATASSCRFCGAPLGHVLIDLGMSPLCESYLAADQINRMEPFYPLHVYVCERCFLVQLEEYVAPAHIFSEYAYFSSYSSSWREHARRYAEAMRARFGLGRDSLVAEVGSNDGYLLEHFVAAGVPVLGIEPAANVAAAAVARGVPTVVRFFGRAAAGDLVAQSGQADLVVGNNVLAQIPDPNDCVAGMKVLLAPRGVV